MIKTDLGMLYPGHKYVIIATLRGYMSANAKSKLVGTADDDEELLKKVKELHKKSKYITVYNLVPLDKVYSLHLIDVPSIKKYSMMYQQKVHVVQVDYLPVQLL